MATGRCKEVVDGGDEEGGVVVVQGGDRKW